MDEEHTAPRGDASRARPWLTVVRWLALLLPVGWLAGRVQPELLLDAVRSVGLRGFTAGVVFQLLSTGVGALRWRWLLHGYGAAPERMPSTAALFRHSLVGLYFSMLPSGLVGEVVRARRTEGVLPVAADAYVVALLDRIAGAVGLLVLAAVSVLALPPTVARPAVETGLRVVAVLAVGASLGMVGLPWLLARSDGLRAKVASFPLLGAQLAALTPPTRPSGLAVAMLLSVLTQALTVVSIAALVVPVAPDVPVVRVLAQMPMIILLTFVPITPGAVGQRELAFVTLLGPLGVGVSDATASSLVTLAMALVLAALGAALYAWDVARDRRVAGASTPRSLPPDPGSAPEKRG